MLRRILASSRYIVLIAIAGTFAASLALILYEAVVVVDIVIGVVRRVRDSPRPARPSRSG